MNFIDALTALKDFKFFHTILTSFIAGAYILGVLTGNPGAENLKEISFIVITFWYSQNNTERAITTTVQRLSNEQRN